MAKRLPQNLPYFHRWLLSRYHLPRSHFRRSCCPPHARSFASSKFPLPKDCSVSLIRRQALARPLSNLARMKPNRLLHHHELLPAFQLATFDYSATSRPIHESRHGPRRAHELPGCSPCRAVKWTQSGSLLSHRAYRGLGTYHHLP